jgi:thiol-disulfide isomerase/thioredoxin
MSPVNAFVLMICAATNAAGHQTSNFVVDAPDPELACEIASTAELLRDALAIEWLGRPLPKWTSPCRISVSASEDAGGGSTTFQFERGEVFGWKMQLSGSRETILADHLPHEIMHTVLASHFRRPLDGWVSEGLAQAVESAPVRATKLQRVRQAVAEQQHLPLRKLIRGEVSNRADELHQAQSLTLVLYLQHLGGRAVLIACLDDVADVGSRGAIREQYGIQKLKQLEIGWLDWINGTTGSGVRSQSAGKSARPQAERQVLFFMADWCGPCQQMLPLVQKLEREGYPIRRVDVDKSRDLAQRHEITSIPVCLVIEDSSERSRVTGVVGEDELRKLLTDPR